MNLGDPVLHELSIRADCIEAIRNWERRGDQVDKARRAYEANPTQRAKNRYELHADALKSDRNFALCMLTRVGKKITVDGFHYRAIASRLEIKKTPCRRHAKESKS